MLSNSLSTSSISRASGVDARLDLSAVPLLDGALATASAGLRSSLHPHNVRLRRAVAGVDRLGDDPRYLLLYDPQTAGGLLAGVPVDQADACLAELPAAGYAQSAVIGAVEPRRDPDPPIHIE